MKAPKMNNQERFNIAALHLIKQGKQSKNLTGSCRYRDGNLMCGVGPLIPEDLYKSNMEGKDVTQLPRLFPELVPYVGQLMSSTQSLLQDIQRLHDLIDFEEFCTAINAPGVEHNASALYRNLIRDDRNRVFDIPTLKTCLTHVAQKHGLNTEVLS